MHSTTQKPRTHILNNMGNNSLLSSKRWTKLEKVHGEKKKKKVRAVAQYREVLGLNKLVANFLDGKGTTEKKGSMIQDCKILNNIQRQTATNFLSSLTVQKKLWGKCRAAGGIRFDFILTKD